MLLAVGDKTIKTPETRELEPVVNDEESGDNKAHKKRRGRGSAEDKALRADVRREFITDAGSSLQSLSEKHGIPLITVRQWAYRESWHKDKKLLKDKVDEKAFSAAAQTRAQKLSAFDADAFKMASAVRGLLAKKIADARSGKSLSLSDINLIMRTESEAHKVGRLALGASTENHQLTGKELGPVDVRAIPLEAYTAATKRALDEY